MADRKIILISDEKLHLSRSFSVALSEIFSSDLKFSSRDIFWEVEGTYNAGILLLRVVNYRPTDYSNFGKQEVSKPVTKIEFENLNWNELQHFLWSWNGMTQKTIETRYTGPKSEPDKQLATTGTFSRRISQVLNFIPVEDQKPIQTTVHENFDMLYKDATIKNGKIVFEKKFPWYHARIPIQIENPFLKEEFDSIKFYFGKAINRAKRFTVQAAFTLHDNIVTDISATSSEIEQINSNLVDVIKKKRIAEVVHIQSNKGKSLVDADELFESLDGNEKNPLNQTSEEIIKEIITWEGIRNGKQLQYLSGLKQSKSHKILFSLKPHFGFMFTIQGKENSYFCWELLDSHATYVWSLDNLQASTERTEEIITCIQEIGRNRYKQLYKSGTIDQDAKFTTIIHSNNNEQDPFAVWKRELDKITK